MKFGTLINSLATKAGITTDNKALIDLLSRTDLSNADIADEIANKIEGSLFDLETAKNNPLVKNHFFAQALNGIDAEMDRVTIELGIDETDLADYRNEKSTNKKISILTKKIADITAKKNQSNKEGNAENEAKYKAEIDKLNGQLRDIRTGFDTEKQNLANKHLAEIADMRMDFILGTKKYANAGLPADVNTMTAKAIIQKTAQEKGAKIK